MLLILQIINLCYNKDDIAEKAQRVVDRFAERGLRSLAVAYQVVRYIELRLVKLLGKQSAV